MHKGLYTVDNHEEINKKNNVLVILPDIFRRKVDLVKCKMTGVFSA